MLKTMDFILIGISIMIIILIIYFNWTKTESMDLTVYCINLPNHKDRRDSIQRYFSSLRIDYIDAVDATDHRWRLYTDHLTDDAIIQLENVIKTGKRNNHYDLTPGAVGCFLSHLKCYHTFLEKDASDILLILEDDSLPNSDFFVLLQNILHDVPDDADIILLSHIFNGTHTKIRRKRTTLYRANADASFYLTNSYLITRRGMKKILAHIKENGNKFDCQIDSYYSRLSQKNKLVIYLTETNICPQSNAFGTSIQTIPI